MSTDKPIRVLLADDHTIVRIGIAAVLDTEDGIKIVGEATNGDEAIEQALRLQPDVVVMDLMMPKKDGIDATSELHRQSPKTKIVLLTTYSTSDGIAKALAKGADGALLKSTADADLIPAIRAVADGGRFISSEIDELLASDPPAPELTDRQRDILHSVTRGLTNNDIAKQFGISEITIRNHLKVIYDKLGAGSRSEAVAIALRKQLLKL